MRPVEARGTGMAYVERDLNALLAINAQDVQQPQEAASSMKTAEFEPACHKQSYLKCTKYPLLPVLCTIYLTSKNNIHVISMLS